jgi:hypothetical protein
VVKRTRRPPWACAFLAGTVLALARGGAGGAGCDVADAACGDSLSARWFYEQGVALQVADGAAAPDVCLRAFRAAARLLDDGVRDPLFDLVQNASREVSLRAKARRVGGTLRVSVELRDSVGPVPLSWWLGADLRDVADYACCVEHGAEGPARCFEYSLQLAASQPAPAWEGGRGRSSEEEEETCASYVLSLLVRSEETFRDQTMARPADAKRPPRYMPVDLEDDFLGDADASVEYMYRDDSFPGYYQRYSRTYLEAMAAMVRRRSAGTNYPSVDELLYRLLSANQSLEGGWGEHGMKRGEGMGGGGGEWGMRVRTRMKGAAVVVIGSVVPWYEVLALEYGASRTVTIEYNHLSHDHPAMTALTPSEYWGKAEDERETFQVGLSISSIEHDGLGR